MSMQGRSISQTLGTTFTGEPPPGDGAGRVANSGSAGGVRESFRHRRVIPTRDALATD